VPVQAESRCLACFLDNAPHRRQKVNGGRTSSSCPRSRTTSSPPSRATPLPVGVGWAAAAAGGARESWPPSENSAAPAAAAVVGGAAPHGAAGGRSRVRIARSPPPPPSRLGPPALSPPPAPSSSRSSRGASSSPPEQGAGGEGRGGTRSSEQAPDGGGAALVGLRRPRAFPGAARVRRAGRWGRGLSGRPSPHVRGPIRLEGMAGTTASQPATAPRRGRAVILLSWRAASALSSSGGRGRSSSSGSGESKGDRRRGRRGGGTDPRSLHGGLGSHPGQAGRDARIGLQAPNRFSRAGHPVADHAADSPCGELGKLVGNERDHARSRLHLGPPRIGLPGVPDARTSHTRRSPPQEPSVLAGFLHAKLDAPGQPSGGTSQVEGHLREKVGPAVYDPVLDV